MIKLGFGEKALESKVKTALLQSAAEKISHRQTKVDHKNDNQKLATTGLETPFPKLSHLACQSYNDASNSLQDLLK